MKGQLYKIPIKSPALLFDENPHDPAGDPIVDDEDFIRGFVMCREGDDLIILLIQPRELPPGAIVLKEECHFTQELSHWVDQRPDVMVPKLERVAATAKPFGLPEHN